MATRSDLNEINFVKISKEWIEAPYVHQAEQRFGCDCTGLFTGVLKEMGYDPSCFDLPDRPVNALSDQLLWQVEKACLKLDTNFQDSVIGSILLFKVGDHVQHIAVKSGEGLIIHCDRFVGKVVEVGISDGLLKRLIGIYQINWQKLPRSQND
jgi:cell wall-associated NlpC family hydrolase